MNLRPTRINWFLLFKLPSAYLAGVRVHSLEEGSCITSVRLRWINQNPFKSLFWAVQGMAAELTTGVLLLQAIGENRVSMLVTKNEGSFHKKARGRIQFNCQEGAKAREAVQKALETGLPVVCALRSTGVDAQGEKVSEFIFEWSLKRKEK